MALVNGDLLEMVIFGRQDGQLTANVLHYDVFGTDATQSVATALEAFRLAHQPHWKGNLSVEWRWEACKGQRLLPLPRQDAVLNITGAGDAVQVGQAMPTEVTLVITKRTGNAGRRFRGRSYIPGIPITYVADSAITIPGLTGLQFIANAMLTAIPVGISTLFPVVYSRKFNLRTTVTSTLVRTTVRAQRRRQLGVGGGIIV